MSKQDETTEIRWHGRGGQGAVTSAELVALAAIDEGKFAQAFPSFGPERRGAPVLAFNRVNTSGPIRDRSSISTPNVVVVLDPGLLTIVDVLSGLKDGGALIVNTPRSIDSVKAEFGGPWKIAVIDATTIARETLGVPIVNTTMIGAVVKVTGIIELESLEEPITERFGVRGKNNVEACRKAYEGTIVAEPVAAVPRQTIAAEVLPSWEQILVGSVVNTPGSAKQYRTGDWSSSHTEYDYSKCIKCGLCYMYCPEACVKPIADGFFAADIFYCKGCGLCAKECPKSVISMVEGGK